LRNGYGAYEARPESQDLTGKQVLEGVAVTREKKALPAWYLGWAAFGILAMASALVVWRTQGTLLRWIVRDLALLGYIAVFLAIASFRIIRERSWRSLAVPS
jgi:hypothetical protein